MVIPRSFSRSIESRNCSLISRLVRAPVFSMSRSESVVLPWSMCAMIEKLRMFCMKVRRGAGPCILPWNPFGASRRALSSLRVTTRSPRSRSIGRRFVSVLIVRFPLEPQSCRMTTEPSSTVLEMKRLENQDQRMWGSKG